MKNYLEKIIVEGTQVEIAFEFLHISEPVQVLEFNEILSINLVDKYIKSCEVACADFLKAEAFAKNESLQEERGDEEFRGN